MKKFIMFIVLCLCFVVPSLYVHAADTIIDVYINNGNEIGYFETTASGYKGYYYDYLMSIKEDNWEYNFILSSPTVLTDHAIVIGTTQGKFTYELSKPVVQDKYIAAFDPANANLGIDNINSFYGKLINYSSTEMVGNQTIAQAFSEYLKANGIIGGTGSSRKQGKITYQASTGDARSLVKNGSCDAYLMKSSYALENEFVTGFVFTSVARYIHAGSQTIANALENNIKKIENLEPTYLERLYDNYFGRLYTRSLSFSAEESSYMQTPTSYRVGVVASYAPYSYIENDQLKGIVIEYFNKITALSNGKLLFSFTTYDNRSELDTAMQKNEIDIIGFKSTSIGNGDEIETRSYYNEKLSLFNFNNGGEKVVCFNQAKNYVISDYVDEKIVIVNNNDEFREAIKMSDVGAFVATRNHGNFIISAEGLQNVSVLRTYDTPLYFTVELSPAIDKNFTSIINKLTDSIDEKMFDDIATNIIASQAVHDRIKEKVSIKDFIKKYSVPIFAGILGVFLTIIALLIVILCIVLKQKKKNYKDLYIDEITFGPKYRKFLMDGTKVTKGNWKYAILYLDIINFKSINTKFGISKADEVLRSIYDRLKLVTRNLDLMCRKYADRFLLLIHYNNLDKLVSESMTNGDLLYKYLMKEFPDFNLSFRAGIYPFDKNDDLDTACEYASEAALTIDKKAGFNAVLYDESLMTSNNRKHEIESQMERAIINEEFKVYYQPKVDALEKKLVGAEALVRWIHPEKGKMSPAEFIPLFEKNGFIIKLDFYVFEHVCKYLSSEIKAGRKPVVISSNFSKLHLESTNFIDKINYIVGKYNVPKEYIEIELTETMEPGSYERLCDIVRELSELGYKISIDDFGSGNSSFQLIYDLPITTLKVDAVFVRNLDKTELEEELMTSVISLCLNHNIHIVCEGVETKEELDYVLKHNCSVIQGYYYSKPLPLDEFMLFKVE